MKVQSWLSDQFSDADHQSITSIDTNTIDSSNSLQSNISLQTLPSVISLQYLSLEALNLSVSHLNLTSFKPLHNVPINCLAVSAGFLYAASGSEINVYDSITFALVDSFNGRDSSSGAVKSISFINGQVITAHQDSKIKVWKLTEGKRHKLLGSLPTVNDRLKRFLLAKNYVNVRRHSKRLWIQHADAVSGLAVSDDLICSVSWDKCLKIWRGSSLRCLQSINAHDDAINAVTVSSDGTIYTGSADRRIRVWAKRLDEKRHSLIATLEKHRSAVNALALSTDGSVLFSGACDRSILVWEREDTAKHMAVTGALRGHDKAILCLINVKDTLFSGSTDRTIRIWQRGGFGGQYCCLAVLEGHLKPVKSIVTTNTTVDTISIVSGSLDGEIKAWKVMVSNFKRLSSLK